MSTLSKLYYGNWEADLAALKASAEARYPGTFTKDTPKMTMAMATRIDPLAVTNDQRDLIRRTIAKDATPDELTLYLYDCQRQGVHPLDKLIHFTKRSGKYTPITSIDFMRMRAADTGEYAGSDDADFWQVADKSHQSHPDSATVTVWRLVQGQRCSFTATARWAEYCPPSGQDHMWRKMPHTMLGKCAEALALRKGFPRQLAGLYAKEEMDQADSQRPAVVDAPAPPEKREKPSEPNGGDSAIDITTGEELPPGFARIDDLKQDGAWLQVWWGRDAKDGWRKLSTKVPKIANEATAAFEDKAPVRLHSKDGKYLDRVERYVAPVMDEAVPF